MRQLLLVTGLCLLLPAGTHAAPPRIGEPAPRFTLRDRDGVLVSLSRLAAAKDRPRVILLDFFRTDCKPCRHSLPLLAELHKKLGPRGLRIFLIALLEEQEGEEKLKQFLARAALPFTVLMDPYALAAKKYVVKGGSVRLPALFVIDERGVLRARLGAIDPKKPKPLVDLLQKMLPR